MNVAHPYETQKCRGSGKGWGVDNTASQACDEMELSSCEQWAPFQQLQKSLLFYLLHILTAGNPYSFLLSGLKAISSLKGSVLLPNPSGRF